MKKEDNIFCLFIKGIDQVKILNIYQNYIESIIKNYGKFTIICFSGYSKKNSTKKFKDNLLKKKFKSKFEILYPKNKFEFIRFIKNKKVFALDALGKEFNDYKIRYLINQKNIFLILLCNIGYISNEYTGIKQSNKSLIWSYGKFFRKYLYRILILFNIFSLFFLYFESKAKTVDAFLNSNIRKFINKIPNLKFLKNFLNIYRINSNPYENFLKLKKIKKNNKIIFLDSNYRHAEIIQRESLDLSKIETEYFDLLADKFTNLEKIYKKKIEICLHPTSNLNFYKKKLKRFKVTKGNTIKRVLGSHMVIAHDSSSIMEALVAKKKVLILETNFFGNYISNRMQIFKKTLKLPSIDLHSNKSLNKGIFKDYKKTEKFRNRYINNNHIKNYGKFSSTFFIETLDKFIKARKNFKTLK